MKKYLLICLVVMSLLTLTLAVSAVEFNNSIVNGLNVTTDVDGALNEAQNHNKTVVLIFDQDSRYYCDMFMDDVLSKEDVQKQLNEKYVVVFVDINKNSDIAAKYQIFGTPSVVFLDSNGKEMSKIEGYVEADGFMRSFPEL